MKISDPVVAFSHFNAVGSDKYSWMSAETLLTSSWDDLMKYTKDHPTTVSVDGLYVHTIENLLSKCVLYLESYKTPYGDAKHR